MKKFVVLLMSLVLILSVVTGCSSTGETDSLKEVMGKVNGIEITREMLKTELEALESTAVGNYIDNYLVNEFYKDMEINDSELTIQMEILKGQVGEGQWESYISYMGYSDEEAFKKVVKLDMQKNKMKDTLKSQVIITEEDLQKAFTESPDVYKVLSGDMIFFDTVEEYTSAQNMLTQEGMTLQAISDSLEKDIYPNENVTFSFGGFTKPMDSMNVGDLVATKSESGTYAVIKVTKVSKTFEELKSAINSSLINDRTTELVEIKLTQFYNEAKVEILGETIQ